MRASLLLLLIVQSAAFYVTNQNENEEAQNDLYIPKAQELRSNANSIELFGQRMEVPAWMNTAAVKTREMFDSATNIFERKTSSSRKSSNSLLTNLKKDETTRIWFAVYLNILVIVLIYIFITIKLVDYTIFI
uniref:RxLR effector protein n=1 Tax=Caenorhabditis tropicalis TaxID=1561998 RepID=A0A1I7UHZ2_9PELO